MASSEALRTTLCEIGAYEVGHIVLNSGLHSEVKVNVDSLAEHPDRLLPFLDNIEEVALETGVDLLCAVPSGGVRLLSVRDWTSLQVIRPHKIAKRDFCIDSRDLDRVKEARNIGIFEDAITTGGTPAALAQVVRSLNPDADLHLFGMVRRGEILASHAQLFASQVYLLEENIPTWPAEECPACFNAEGETL